MKIELQENEANYIRELLRKDARERGDTDIANWCLVLSDKFEEVTA